MQYYTICELHIGSNTAIKNILPQAIRIFVCINLDDEKPCLAIINHSEMSWINNKLNVFILVDLFFCLQLGYRSPGTEIWCSYYISARSEVHFLKVPWKHSNGMTTVYGDIHCGWVTCVSAEVWYFWGKTFSENVKNLDALGGVSVLK